MADTTLTLSAQPSDIDRGTYVDIEVTTNASDYNVTLDNDNISYEKLANNILRITGNADGSCGITVSATASGYNTTEKKWYVQVAVVATNLQINPSTVTGLKIGDHKVITVITNAQSGYEVTTSNELYARIINKKDTSFTIEGTGIGTATITITSQKNYSDLRTITMTVDVEYVASADDAGNPTAIKLVNTTTNRTVSIQTSNNESSTDIIISLPTYSGTLITQESLETDVKVIKQPYIITPATNTDNWNGNFIASAYETNLGSIETHDHTVWEVAHDREFTEVFYIKEIRKDDVNEINTLEKVYMQDIGYYVACYVRVKYFSKSHESDWSEPIYIRTAYVSLHGITTPKATYTRPASETQGKTYGSFSSNYFGAYYGIVPHSALVDDYDYRGTWNTIKTSYTAENYIDSSTLPIRMKKGFQVIHNNKYWYALKEDAPATAAAMIEPGKDSTMWAEDNRTALGTPRRVAEEIGIGFGNPDANCDGLSSGATAVGSLVNSTLGYIKYIYNGKLCYTPVKPICNVIAWTDLAKREAVYGNRTIRLGTELFMVRLMKEAEYKELFTRLTDGTYDSLTADYLGLTQSQWIEDFQEGANRKVASQASDISTLDAKSRTGAWRFVLEYIPEYSAPYNNLEVNFPNVHKADTENFIYDRYSDTGYFGHISAANFITNTELDTMMGWTSGTVIYTDSDWFKFYWHGQICLMQKRPSRHLVNYNMILQSNLHHGTDMGGTGKKTVTINGCTYRAMNSIGANETPYTKTGFTEADLTKLPTGNLELHIGKYSQWNELMYRISEGYLGYTEVNGGTQWNNNCMYYHGGYQIGDNWATFTADELITRYSSSNGTACWQRDLSNSTVLLRGSRGVGSWFGHNALSHSDVNDAFRCLLSLTTNYNVRS